MKGILCSISRTKRNNRSNLEISR